MSSPGAGIRYRTVDLIGKATALLEQKGVISPRLNAETLLAEATGMSRVELYTNFENPYPPRRPSASASCSGAAWPRAPAIYHRTSRLPAPLPGG